MSPRRSTMWTITRDGVFYASGSAQDYPQAFAAGMTACWRFIDSLDGVTLDDPIWDVGARWAEQTSPTSITVAGFTITTGPVTQ